MTPEQPIKYNPSFLSQRELIRAFVVRQMDLELIMEVVRENTGPTNQHILVIGSRGAGKTMLALRAAAEIRQSEELSNLWYPIVFAEESYEVCSPGEFWLAVLFHLGEQTKDARWQKAFEELRMERDESRLRERALSQVMDFADEQGKRLLLVVENLNMLLGEQISSDEAWVLRHLLLNESNIMLLGTATSRFEQLDNSEKAMFELFKIHELIPLDSDSCRTLWTSITGQELEGDRIKPMKILTGGNPRLLVIISAFAAKTSFKELMDDLTRLVDEHTEYFKSHLDNLPPLERKVFVALADLWKPSTAREVADAARIDVNKSSSCLKRLQSKGAVVEVDKEGRRKWYQLAERMYNIYHLMRRRGEPSSRVHALVDFMVHFYHDEELAQTAATIAAEACALAPELRRYHYLVLEGVLKSPETERYREKIIQGIPKQFFESPDLPKSFRQIEGFDRYIEPKPQEAPSSEEIRTAIPQHQEDPMAWVRLAGALIKEENRSDDVEKACLEAIKLDPENVYAWRTLAWVLKELNRYEEAEQAYRKAIEIDPNYAWAWKGFGDLLCDNLERYEEAEQAYRKAIEIDPNYVWAWDSLGDLLCDNLQRYEEAEQAYRKAIEIDPSFKWAWDSLGNVLGDNLQRYEEAEQAYRKVIEIDPSYAWAWVNLGSLLQNNLKRYEEAEWAYRKAIEIDSELLWAWGSLGFLLHGNLDRYEEAEQAYRKVLEIDSNDAIIWSQLGMLLHGKLKRYEEAKEAYVKAIEIAPSYQYSWIRLIKLQMEAMRDPDAALKTAEEFLESSGRTAKSLNSLAWLFLKCGWSTYLEHAEAWSREAVRKEPGKPECQHTFASILGTLGKWEEALEIAPLFLGSEGFLEKRIGEVSDFFINGAASGFAEESLGILEQHLDKPTLEPLITGLKIFLGEKVLTAQEIREVGEDVAKRIHERIVAKTNYPNNGS